MTKSVSPGQANDAEMAAIVERFERLYASLGGRAEPEPEEAPAPATALFGQENFELPADQEWAVDARDFETGDAAAAAQLRFEAEPLDGRAAGAIDSAEDIDDAVAILRDGESKRPLRAEGHPQAARDEVEEVDELEDLAPPPARRSHSLRRYAVPALAATIFATLATGYVVTRHNDAPAPSAVLSSPLKLDYDLAPSKAGEAIVARKTR